MWEPKLAERKLDIELLKLKDSVEETYLELKAHDSGERLDHSFQIELAMHKRIEPNPGTILTKWNEDHAWDLNLTDID